ncbi:family 76 glycoside hydrolase [Aureobasidium pullulans]|uniref:mannan endo-1,6-alpha-mannosidase n=1 Tax=Aureobasidium pullulans TaxID=5580 RepID=A0A4V4IXX5_AURPU|nr:family 76 glycoside hydrolase [Aureobasidium pullulans]
MKPFHSSWLVSTLVAAAQFGSALQLTVSDADSIRSTASVVAYDLMSYYTGNRTGDVPGNLPSPYYWWEAGAMFGEMVEYWYYTGDTTYNDEVKQALLHQVGDDKDYMPRNQSKSLGNDDQVFWAFSAMTAAELKFEDPGDGQPSWLSLAQAVFNEQASRWDDATCGGGLRWQIFTFNAGYDYKNAVSNGGFFQLAARLARYTQNQTYVDWAEKTWEWYAGTPLLETDNWQVNDGSGTQKNCSDASQLQWTYNYGVFLAGNAYLYNYTGDAKYMDRIDGLLNSTLERFFPDKMGGVMVEVTCEPLGNCNNDQPAFKAFLTRWLVLTAQLVPEVYDRIFEYLRKSAAGAAGQCSGGELGRHCGREWNSTVWDGTSGVGEQMSALAIIQAMMLDTTELAAPVGATTGGTSKGDPSAEPLENGKPIVGDIDGSNVCWKETHVIGRSHTSDRRREVGGVETVGKKIIRHNTIHTSTMPPRLNLLSRASLCRPTAPHSSVASLLQPFLRSAQQPQQQRNASILSSLSDNSGAYNKKIRRGRGPSSGKGKTSGRGHKGQKAHGKVPRNFNGGQTPEEVVHGVRGFENQHSIEMTPLNINRLQAWIDAGRLDPNQPITLRELAKSRCIHGIKDGIKLLARSSEKLTTPVDIVVSRASASAIAAIEAAGGKVTTRYYTKPSISRVRRGETDPIYSIQSAEPTTPRPEFKYRLPDPASRKDIEYYRDPAHRGYLSHMLQEGQGPSLFFKTPGQGRVDHKKVTSKGAKSAIKGENRVW